MAERAMSRAGKAAKASHGPSPSSEGSYFPDPSQSGWQPESAPSGMPRIVVRLSTLNAKVGRQLHADLRQIVLCEC